MNPHQLREKRKLSDFVKPVRTSTINELSYRSKLIVATLLFGLLVACVPNSMPTTPPDDVENILTPKSPIIEATHTIPPIMRTPIEVLIPSPNQTPSLDPYYFNDCEDVVQYTVQEYQDGWERVFKRTNKLSDSEFNSHITIIGVTLRSRFRTCLLQVSYSVKKDWFVTKETDRIELGIPPTMLPGNLPLLRLTKNGVRGGVSKINLHDRLSFNSETEAQDYFINAFDMNVTAAWIDYHGFNPFFYLENAEARGLVGQGGELFVAIRGILDMSKNKCYRGVLSLVDREMSYHEGVCLIIN